MAPAHKVLAVVTLVVALAACKSPEQIQREQDQADEQRCASMGVPVLPGDPQYIQCRMWAAEMRTRDEQERRQAWLAALTAMSAMQQQQRAPAYQMPPYEDEPQPQQWLMPPPAPPTTWCRPVGRWMSCTSQ